MLEQIVSLMRQIEVADPFAPLEERSMRPAKTSRGRRSTVFRLNRGRSFPTPVLGYFRIEGKNEAAGAAAATALAFD